MTAVMTLLWCSWGCVGPAGVVPGTEVEGDLAARAPALARSVAAAPGGFVPARSVDDLPPEVRPECATLLGHTHA